MHPNYSYCVIQRILLLIERQILLDGYLKHSLLTMLCTMSLLSDVLTRNDMLYDFEWKSHHSDANG